MSEHDEESIFDMESISIFDTDDYEINANENINGDFILSFLSDHMDIHCEDPKELIESLKNHSRFTLEAAEKLEELVTSGKYKKIISEGKLSST